MPTTTTDAVRLTRVARHFADKSDADKLTTARDLLYWNKVSGLSYADIVTKVTTRDGRSTISTKTISLYLSALTTAGGDKATPETFGAAYTAKHNASRTPAKRAPKGEKGKKEETVTPGKETVTVTNAETALQAFAALLTTVDALPARNRQRVIASMTRTLSRRYTKAA